MLIENNEYCMVRYIQRCSAIRKFRGTQKAEAMQVFTECSMASQYLLSLVYALASLISVGVSTSGLILLLARTASHYFAKKSAGGSLARNIAATVDLSYNNLMTGFYDGGMAVG